VNGLERFVDAQDAEYSGYQTALTEIRQGRKRSHWIWYVFPQLAGLGQSAAAQRYGIGGRSEAVEYVHHPVLRDRLLDITEAVDDQARKRIPLATLMSSDIDATKLVSSMTLFNAVAAGVDEELAAATGAVLERAAAQGYPACEFTLRTLAASR
jgi:uncharacterized protein (DUF1810 family)